MGSWHPNLQTEAPGVCTHLEDSSAVSRYLALASFCGSLPCSSRRVNLLRVPLERPFTPSLRRLMKHLIKDGGAMASGQVACV